MASKSELPIGVLGTRATVASHIYETTLFSMAAESGLKIEVFSQPAPLLVPLAEEGWIDDPITNLIAYRYVQPLLQKNIDTLILGCTHYPILRQALQRAAGASINLVESGAALAQSLEKKFFTHLIEKRISNNQRKIEIMATDLSPQFQDLARSLLAPNQPDSFELVHLNTK